MISPSSSCRPSACRRSAPALAQERRARGCWHCRRCASGSSAVAESPMMLFRSGERPRRGGDDLAAASCRAAGRTAACPRSQSGWRHLASSSHQAASNCGPRRLSGVVGGEELGDGAVAPDDLVARDLIARTLARRVHAEQARDTFHHDAAHLGDGETDERDAAGRRARRNRIADCLGAHPFGSGARLARAAAPQQQPRLPGLAAGSGERRELIGAGPQLPVVDEVGEELGREVSKEFVARFTRQAG